ncbi:MAG: hypothetical protein WDA27_00125 [Actinomycetota bacterium]
MIELVVVSALLVVAVTAMVTAFDAAQRSTIRQQKRSEVADDLSVAMARMTKEVRQADAVRIATASILQVDTFVKGTAVTVTYTASGTTLTRAVAGASVPLVQRLTNTNVFVYSPALGSPATISIRLRARPERFSTDEAVVELADEVKMRNVSP